ncbi:MAG: hypothetical protein V1871_08355 [Planctomycetota bacterium]
MPSNITSMQIVEVWLAVGFSLMIYSFLYKDNPLFKLGEYIYVGLTAGYGLCYTWFMVVWPDLINPLSRVISSAFGKTLDKPLESYETIWLIVPLILGIFMLARFSAKISWLSRYSFAFIMGVASGMAIPLVISADIFKQMVPTLQPLWNNESMTLLQTAFQTNNISAILGGVITALSPFIILIGVITVLIYFFFSMEHKGVVNIVARIGIFYMMVSFGAAFGYTVMARESLAIGRLTKLVKWASVDYYYASFILLVIVTILIILWEIFRRKTNSLIG